MKKPEKPFSPTMLSALQAASRLRSASEPDAALWTEFLETLERLGVETADPRQGSKPAGR